MTGRRKPRRGDDRRRRADSFRGPPHRRAILMDNSAELAAGALSKQSGAGAGRRWRAFLRGGYPDWQHLIAAESALPEPERIDYLTIVTPIHAHFGPAEAAAGAGLAMVCEQPMTTTLDEARTLCALVVSHEIPFLAAFTYTGYPMVMLARELVREGEIGEIRKVEAWYPQGWLSRRRRTKGPNSRRGASIPPGRRLWLRRRARDPRLPVRPVRRGPPRRPAEGPHEIGCARPPARRRLRGACRAEQGAIATITASQITTGAQNDNGFRIIGTTGTLVWSHTHFAVLEHYAADQPVRLHRQGSDYRYLPGSIHPVPSSSRRPSRGLPRSSGQSSSDARMDPPPRPGRSGAAAV